MRFIVLVALVFSVFMYSNQVFAKSWWDVAKDALNSEVLDEKGGPDFGSDSVAGILTSGDIGAGLKEALVLGTEHVVGQLGVQNGFNLDPDIHIALPSPLARVDKALSAVGLSSLTDDLEVRINRAAEVATPKAKALFIDAIAQMTIEDARSILSGRTDAATHYLRQTMGMGLEKEMQPLVQSALASAGAVQAYDHVMGRYAALPFMPDVKADLNAYVVRKAMDGIFYYVAKEEAEIRRNPFKRSTELLKKVFAHQ